MVAVNLKKTLEGYVPGFECEARPPVWERIFEFGESVRLPFVNFVAVIPASEWSGHLVEGWAIW